MGDAGGGASRGVDDHVQAGGGDHADGVIGNEGGSFGQGIREGGGRALSVVPAGPPERLDGPRRGEIGDGGEVYPPRLPGLGQIHAAELSRADETDPEGAFFPMAFRQKGMEVHGFSLQEGKGNNPSHQWAVDNTWLSFPCAPTICNPSGSPRGPNPTGMVMAGTPQRLQMEQKAGLPVCSRVAGASPVVGGVMRASYLARKRSSSSCRAERSFRACR